VFKVNFVVHLSFNTGRSAFLNWNLFYWEEKETKINKQGYIYIMMITRHTEEKSLTGQWAWMPNEKWIIISSVLEIMFL